MLTSSGSLLVGMGGGRGGLSLSVHTYSTGGGGTSPRAGEHRDEVNTRLNTAVRTQGAQEIETDYWRPIDTKK